MLIEAMVLAAWSAVRMDGLVMIDLAADAERRVIVDREDRQYLGHVSTVRVDGPGTDGNTIVAVYPKGHGGGEIVLKRSLDGGRTWGERLPTPASWKTSRECPSVHQMVDAAGKRRLVLWTGLFPARFSTSEDDGVTWTELKDAADGLPEGERWGGIVVMSSAEEVRRPGGKGGSYLAWFHDDGRYFRANGRVSRTFTLYQVETNDGGMTWQAPRAILDSDEVSVCEPGTLRSPDGTTLVMLLREESRRRRSQVTWSRDEGDHWEAPKDLPLALTGDKHTARYAPDGRLVVCFREHTVKGSITGEREATSVPGASEWEGDWVLWVGTYEDLEHGRDGQYKVRLMDNLKAWDCAYPGVEVLKDGTLVLTTYGHWEQGREPYIVCVRLTLAELDARAGAK